MPPEAIETRSFPLSELRVDQTDDGPEIRGYAAVFNQWSQDLGGFIERVLPGAFTKTLQEADIRALWQHDKRFVFGRNRADTLFLEEDSEGLNVRMLPPDATWARDAMETMRRGDVDQMSFRFKAIRDRWHEVDGTPARDLVEVKLFEVSPETFPAYPQTSVSVRVRSVLDGEGIDFEALAQVMTRSRAGLELRSEDRELLEASIGVLREIDGAPAEGGHPPEPEEEPESRARLAMFRRRLEIAEAEL